MRILTSCVILTAREVRKMYLDGNFFTVVIGALIVIPVCKMIMDYVYPRYLVSNVGVGIRPDYPPELYAAIFAVIIGLSQKKCAGLVMYSIDHLHCHVTQPYGIFTSNTC